jgi:tetratricopeptide (TPR) repeat protein
LAGEGEDLDPDNPDAHGHLAFVYRSAGLYDAALECIERVRALDPGHPVLKDFKATGKSLGVSLARELKRLMEADKLASARGILRSLLRKIKRA